PVDENHAPHFSQRSAAAGFSWLQNGQLCMLSHSRPQSMASLPQNRYSWFVIRHSDFDIRHFFFVGPVGSLHVTHKNARFASSIRSSYLSPIGARVFLIAECHVPLGIWIVDCSVSGLTLCAIRSARSSSTSIFRLRRNAASTSSRGVSFV